ncbi:MAG: selenocysteine-specific translation elongation factor [Planctomycetes bacterium]|nr:selenocysteine-specific translation elongation factor [Planctomycetota bacterium]NUQ33592.1 selenocysteine-specific translation elongation factor [Planctomycetaceae bacterium]
MSASATAAEPILPIVIGTAGHVDHGKSSLVRALTGIDPDRLKEEKERGLTIDIGFANFLHRGKFRVGMVDVPGHERFIKNMVTGATGVDLVILCVAANDGVMLQTREHLEILTLLGIKRGVIAITKADLADKETIELVKMDIAEATKDTFIEGAEMIPFSVQTGEGFDAFKEKLAAMIDKVPPHDGSGAFRMPVQRVFSVKGHGAVLTGIPLSGAVAIGDTVETMPSNQQGKLRHIQAYHGDRERAQAGHSSALNISAIDHHRIHRGHVVAQPGYAKTLRSVIARINTARTLKRALKKGTELKLLIDNSEVTGSLHILDSNRPKIAASETALVRLELQEPVVAATGDRFILRIPSPAVTVAGGRVLSTSQETITHKDEKRVKLFEKKAGALDNRNELAAMTCLEAGGTGLSDTELAQELWLLPKEAEPLIEELLKKGTLLRSSARKLVHKDAWADLGKNILALLETYHKEHPQAAGMPEAELQQRTALEPRLLNEVLAMLSTDKKIVREGEVVCHAKHAVQLSAAQKKALDLIRAELKAGGFSPPELADLEKRSGLANKDFRAVISYLTSRGEAVLLDATFIMMATSIDEAVSRARKFIGEKGEMRAADFRNLLDTTRKYAIPLLEYLDGRGHFINRDGVRIMKR